MEAYSAKELPLNIDLSKSLVKLLGEAKEIYGEYKGYLKSMPFDYKYILENFLINEIYYSFKIDGLKNDKKDMFYFQYMNKNNNVIEFNNMKKCFLYSMTNIATGELKSENLHKMNKLILSNCKKTELTKNSGKYRKKQTYILKPGIAGSSVSFVPVKYTDIAHTISKLCTYFNNKNEEPFVSLALSHMQFERIHPYITANGKMGRMLIPIGLSMHKKEPPLLYISEAMYNLKNTYFTLLSSVSADENEKFIKFFLECIIDQCNLNMQKIKKLNKIYNKDYEAFKTDIGGTTIYKVYPIIIKKIVFTTSDIVEETSLHINSVNKVLKKLVECGYLYKEKKPGTNRVTFRYTNMYNILCS